MNRCLMALLLSSTALLGACAGPSGGETVIQGPSEPIIKTVDVPVYVHVPEANPPKDKPLKKGDPLKHLKTLNENTIYVPDPDDYRGTIYVVPTIPNMAYQIYMAEGKPTTIDLPPGDTKSSLAISKPNKWEILDLGVGENEDGERVQTVQVRPYEAGMRGEVLNIKTEKTGTHRFQINTYKGIFHRGVTMQKPAKNLVFDTSDVLPGVATDSHSTRIPVDVADFGYSIGKADVPWRPSAVFTHAGKTWIELPVDKGPVLNPQVVDTSTGEDRPVNWFVQNKRYIHVPDQVLSKFELRRGGTVIKIERVKE